MSFTLTSPSVLDVLLLDGEMALSIGTKRNCVWLAVEAFKTNVDEEVLAVLISKVREASLLPFGVLGSVLCEVRDVSSFRLAGKAWTNHDIDGPQHSFLRTDFGVLSGGHVLLLVTLLCPTRVRNDICR